MKYSILFLVATISYLSCQPKVDHQESRVIMAEQIDQTIRQYYDSGKFDGTVLVADSMGVIYENAFGMANRDKKIPLTPESMFYLASVSKQFTATAILLLVQQGKIRLEDKIRRYFPELPEIYESITVKQLLTHTSGIPDYYEIMEPQPGFTNQDVLDVLKGIRKLDFQPGDQYHYSNSGYVLLSTLTNRASGETFAGFLKKQAFGKAGLRNTIVFDKQATPVENRAIGYGPDSTLTDYHFRTTGAGGIFSNAEDLYRWDRALSSYKILDKRIQDLAYQPVKLNNDSTVYYGYGWAIDPEDPYHVYHAGELEGFRTFFDRHMDNEITVILLSNNSSSVLEKLSGEIYNMINP